MLVVFVQTWMELLNMITPHNYHSCTSSGKHRPPTLHHNLELKLSSYYPHHGHLLVIFLFIFPYEENYASQNSHKISTVGDQATLL